ncbi:MAG: SsrA-binding protein SmpB [Deltaproteobacteria bacterium]|nr:SsrA-binding protein SmpB [Deltaproteobacteria bacterium]
MGKGKSSQKDNKPGHKLIARNKQAFRNYFITDRHEAGISLKGSEVKSLREGRVSLGDSYAEVRNGEIFLAKCHIALYPQASYNNHEPMRERKLLMHKREILRLGIKLNERGFTLVPLSLYFKDGRVKVELGLGKGKQLHDKRHTVRDRDVKRDMEREMGKR